MTFFEALNRLYTVASYDWIDDALDSKIDAYSLLRWVSHDLRSIKIARLILKNFFFLKTEREKLIYLHSCLPKVSRAPFIKYAKKEEKEKDSLKEELLSSIAYLFKNSVREFSFVKRFAIRCVEQKGYSYWYSRFALVENKGEDDGDS